MEDFFVRGRDDSLRLKGGVVEGLYEAMICLAARNPDKPFNSVVSKYLREKLETCPGFSAFTIDTDPSSPESQPLEFWLCIGELLAQLANEELGKELPAEDLKTAAISWDDDARCRWRGYIEELYAFLSDAMSQQCKPAPLKPWTFMPSKVPVLSLDEYECHQCGSYFKQTAENCPNCGWTWLKRSEW